MKKILFIFLITIFNNKAFADDKMILGLEVYNNKAQCGVCHTFKAARSSGKIGPNLDQLKLSMDRIIYSVTNGLETKSVKTPFDYSIALGVRKMHKVVEHEATPQIMGMIAKVQHLLSVEEAK